MSHEFTEKLSASDAASLLGSGYNSSNDYYIYQSMHEYTVYAVNKDTGEEIADSAIRLDPYREREKRKDPSLPYGGHWSKMTEDNGKRVLLVPYVISIGLVVVTIAFIISLKLGGY